MCEDQLKISLLFILICFTLILTILYKISTMLGFTLIENDIMQYWTKPLQPNNANLVSLYKTAAFFQFREITM